jgi:hypothetical protein
MDGHPQDDRNLIADVPLSKRLRSVSIAPGRPHYARGNLTERRYDFAILGCKQRLYRLEKLFCPFRREYDKFEAIRDFF